MSKQFKKTTIGLHAGTARFHTYNAGLAIDLNDTIAAIVFHHVHMSAMTEAEPVSDSIWLRQKQICLQTLFRTKTECQMRHLRLHLRIHL